MGLTERKLRQQQELKEQIITCSREIVEKEGWAALSIRKIADAIEYSVPVIYKHFENKEAISAHFVQEGFINLLESINHEIDTKESINTKIKQLSLGYWLFAVNFPKHYEIMFGLGIPTCEKTNESEEIKKVSNLMLALIDEAILASGKTDLDRYLKLKTLWSILHGIVAMDLLALNSKENICPSAVLKDAIEGYIKSILV
ncbi:TetR family transcriptional regulator [Sphingobacterium mizutaii NBRC 14946 = DSM 11724]|uniref:Bacterial regulatory proteins, tetR family n=2 Tax=Sphingobacterium mizutaii TaxID=1010 RepID=A0AAJ5BZK4_9SPHI|nr:TetR/AcrR family transcriptional regulator [Sphingobacterium mizutaii]GEM68881.1 TetR family transcriptional regulator [Sphingobacterium mizutaii NBRC 14946 = DSM 11724]SDK89427.1 DNA-binding transcriptional regulator, AcrR family [Sphingobacterium mizutaii]SNV46913.1 Bacterial regulatory proteins, tetR family [Sphingobacterium mizutaii]